MIKFNIGDKIRSISKKTKHVVESVESVSDITVIFTEDIKCFPIQDVEKDYDSFVAEYFIKIFNGVTPNQEEKEKFKKILNGTSN